MNQQKTFQRLKQKIKKEGSDEEKHLFKLGKNILNLVDKLYAGEKYKDKWCAFNIQKNISKENVQRYSGIYLSYFQNELNKIEEQERQDLGYHIHSV